MCNNLYTKIHQLVLPIKLTTYCNGHSTFIMCDNINNLSLFLVHCVSITENRKIEYVINDYMKP